MFISVLLKSKRQRSHHSNYRRVTTSGMSTGMMRPNVRSKPCSAEPRREKLKREDQTFD
jgi:hypothetical protein